jgi:adenylate cyclase
MFHFFRRLASLSHHNIRWALLLSIGLIASTDIWLAPQPLSNPTSFDQMVKKRLWTPAADSKIIIIDIDEASLSQLNAEFGRWPWPRETLAAALEWLESKGTQAVVFDILFSDLDVTHPDSDQAFAQSVAKSRSSYFPILRLNPDNDSLSQIRSDQLQGFVTALGTAPPPSLAVVPPVFESIIQTGRLGYHNIYPDKDGINRHYDLWQDKDGWRMWSLPARIANSFDWDKGEKPRVLINFNKTPGAYQAVPFHEIWRLSQSRAGIAADPRFEGSIVLIGSTASSLFDVKATPISSIHPGVDLLANVIDNLKNQHFLYELPLSVKLISIWVCLVFMGLACTRMKTRTLRWSVLLIPGVLMGISYLSLHTGHWFIDLSGSASHALLFFTVINIYNTWRLNHFSNAYPLVKAQTSENSTLFKAAVVMRYLANDIKPQRLITHATATDAQVAVVHAGFYGEMVGDESGASCVMFIHPNQEMLHRAIQKLVMDESPFTIQSYVSDISSVNATKEFTNLDNSAQIMWGYIANAVIQWEN